MNKSANRLLTPGYPGAVCPSVLDCELLEAEKHFAFLFCPLELPRTASTYFSNEGVNEDAAVAMGAPSSMD